MNLGPPVMAAQGNQPPPQLTGPIFKAQKDGHTLTAQLSQGQYFPGDQIFVSVTLNIAGNGFKMRKLGAEIQGVEHTYWTSGSGKHRRTHRQTVNVVNVPFTLYTPPADKIGFGAHQFPMNYVLPPMLPPSLEHGNNYVRYFLKVFADVPWGFDLKIEAPVLLVPRPYVYPDFVAQLEARNGKNLYCCCFPNGKVSGFLKGPAVLGAQVDSKFLAEIDNSEGEKALTCDLKLNCVYTFKAHNSTRSSVTTIWMNHIGVIPPKSPKNEMEIAIPGNILGNHQPPFQGAIISRTYNVSMVMDPEWSFALHVIVDNIGICHVHNQQLPQMMPFEEKQQGFCQNCGFGPLQGNNVNCPRCKTLLQPVFELEGQGGSNDASAPLLDEGAPPVFDRPPSYSQALHTGQPNQFETFKK